MRVLVIGLGIQGKKRMAIAASDVVATVDPVVPAAQYRTVEEVPLDTYDAALVCTPDQAKPPLLTYLLGHSKHVLVEKPLLAEGDGALRRFGELANTHDAACYTAYNHRFEPHIARLKNLLDENALGPIYLARFFYGNGTAADVKRSPWRDKGLGVLPDLGSHLLDMTLFLFGPANSRFTPWSMNCFENRSCDHVLFGASGLPVLILEGTLISWRNTFTADVFGELGSAHIHGLCKWGPSTLTVRRRVLPSGRPAEDVQTIEAPDPTWALEYEHFKGLCKVGGTNLANDLWINGVLNDLGGQLGMAAAS